MENNVLDNCIELAKSIIEAKRSSNMCVTDKFFIQSFIDLIDKSEAGYADHDFLCILLVPWNIQTLMSYKNVEIRLISDDYMTVLHMYNEGEYEIEPFHISFSDIIERASFSTQYKILKCLN